jgi:DNA-directed RNA polymerase subunit H (RpoH/RPB5)
MTSISIVYNNKENNEIILRNVLNMLKRRKLLSEDHNVNETLNKLSITAEKHIYEFPINNNLKYSIYFINNKLTSITQDSPVAEYLDSDINIHKIIIAKDVAKKVVKQIVSEFKNAEFFFDYELLVDISEIRYIPQHYLLSSEEKTELLSKISDKNLAHIFITDRMSREYAAKVGDIFKIVRPSLTAGKNIFYRKVVNGSWDILFP